MLRHIVRRSLKLIAGLLPLSRRARVAAWILPTRLWYPFALFMSRMQGKLTARSGGNGALTEALILDGWIRELTFSGAYFIPWKLGQAEVLGLQKPGRGVLYCSTHLPLFEMPPRAFIELGHTLDLVVSHPGRAANGDEFVVPGLETRIRAVLADSWVLTKVRTALTQGKSVACLADAELGGPLSSHILRVAGMVGAFVIFQWAEREADGSITINFIPAPHPLCANEQEIVENMEFLQQMNTKMLGELGILPDVVDTGSESRRSSTRTAKV